MKCHPLSVLLVVGIVCGQETTETTEGRHILSEPPLGRYVHDWPGKFKPARLCPIGERVIGFRAQVPKQVCHPKAGPKSGLACIFPFKKNGKICAGPKCCNLDNDRSGAWCSTKVDEYGYHISGNFAYCGGSTCDPDEVGITGLEMKCSGGSIVGPDGIVDSGMGEWEDWDVCAKGSFVSGFNLRYQDVGQYHTRRGDHYGASQIKMVCSDGATLGPRGIDLGKWDEDSGCSATSHFCGFAAEVQDYNGNQDDAGIGRVKFLCCTKAKPLATLPAYGDLTRLASDVCIGSQQERYGIIKMPVTGFLHSLTIVRIDGELTCDDDQRRGWHRLSNFGCEYPHIRDAFSIFVTTSDDEVILPSKEMNQFKSDNLFYEVIGKSARDTKEFSLTASEPTFLTVGKEIRLWYGEDLKNRKDSDNGNFEVCVNVYGKLLN